MLRLRSASLPALASVGAALLLAGCGTDAVPSAVSSEPPSVAPRHERTAPAPTPAASSSTPSDRADRGRHSGHKVDRSGLGQRARVGSEADAHLLAAERMPLVAGAGWAQVDDPEQPTNVGACQKTGLGAIGALEEVRRSFTAPGGLAATQLVARFADARSALRAHGVLVAWRDDCEQRVSGAAVGPLEPVTVRAGSGDSYRASYGSRPRTAGLGILRAGAWLTLVEVSSRDAAYPQRWDPARVAVRRVARTF